MIKIQDIILHKSKDHLQTMLILNRMPKFVYEEKGDLLEAEDSGFFKFFKYEAPSRGFVAFGGREFNIPLKGGNVIRAKGQWWDCLPESFYGLTYSLGIATLEMLEECYVFSSGTVDRKIVDDWLSENKASNNYYKYDKKSPNFQKQTIKSEWE